jgi:hypothetical protein
MENKVIFAKIYYNARFEFQVGDVITNTSFYNAYKRNFIASCYTELVHFNRLKIRGSKQAKKCFSVLKNYVKTIDIDFWEILATFFQPYHHF